MTEIKKILFIRLSSIGDVVLATPLLRAVKKKFPHAEIHFAVKKDFSDLLLYHPLIDKLIVADSRNWQAAVEEIRDTSYDWVLDIHKSGRSNQLLAGVRNALVTTYSKQKLKRFLLIQFKWNLYKEVVPVYQRYFEAAEKFGISDDGEGTEIFFSPAEEKKVNELLAAAGYSGGPVVTVCPGAKFTNKQWTKEGFAEVARKMALTHNVFVVLAGGPGEEQRCEEIRLLAGVPMLNLAGKLKILETAALLKASKAVLANDSGLMHLAQSQKTPVVAIFGPTVKEFGFFPLANQSIVHETKLGCRPCTKMGLNYCPKKHHLCMKNIGADQVFHSLEQFIKA